MAFPKICGYYLSASTITLGANTKRNGSKGPILDVYDDDEVFVFALSSRQEIYIYIYIYIYIILKEAIPFQTHTSRKPLAL